jgi:hypothetical protein
MKVSRIAGIPPSSPNATLSPCVLRAAFDADEMREVHRRKVLGE